MNELKQKNFCYLMLSVFFLCFNSGLLNGVSIIAFGYTTAHMTGNLSYIGYNIITFKKQEFFTHFFLWFSYILGGIVSGLIIPKESFHLKRSYGKILYILIFNIITIYILAKKNIIFCIFIFSFTSGLQNAMTTRYYKKVIRTTHLTGCSTDISLNIAHIIKGNKEDTWVLKIFIPQIFFFIFGVSTAVIGFKYCKFNILFLNIIILLLLIIKHACIVSKSLQISFFRAIQSF